MRAPVEVLVAGALARDGHAEQPAEAQGSPAGVSLFAVVGYVLIAYFLESLAEEVEHDLDLLVTPQTHQTHLFLHARVFNLN